MTDAPLWPAFMGTLLGALIGGGATVLAVFLTTRAQADHEAEARRQDRIEGAYANLARFIGHNASVLAWVQENGFPSKERPLPIEPAGPVASLDASTGAGLFASEPVRTLLIEWIGVHGTVTRAQLAGRTEEAAASLKELLDLNDALMQAMIDDLAGRE
jgi:hypothetical protein